MAILESKPKYRIMKEILLDRLHSGEYRPGEKFLSENELVREFGVSKHTVLKAVNELVNEGFIFRRQGAGTFIRTRKKRSRDLQLHQVAVFYYHNRPSALHSCGLELFTGLERGFCDLDNLSMRLFFTNGNPDREVKLINRLSETVNGFVLITIFHKDEPHPAIETLLEKKIPFVNLLTPPAVMYRDRMNMIVNDDFNGGYLAARHLLETGCDNIVALYPELGKFDLTAYRLRLEGARKAVRSHLRGADIEIIKVAVPQGDDNYEVAGYCAAPQIVPLLDKGKTGIFALMSDRVAFGVLAYLHEQGVKVPGQAAVCGYDNDPGSDKWANNLTTIDSSIQEIGYRGAVILAESIKAGNATAPVSELLPVKLIKRGST